MIAEKIESDTSIAQSGFLTRRVRLMLGLILLLVLMAVNLAILSGKLQVEKVISESMEPTLLIGDVLLADANVVPDRYDIAIVADPNDPEEKLVKRVIGLPGDLIEIRDGILYLNGHEEYSEHITENSIAWPNYRKKIPSGSLFLLGDNRNNSFDSLNFGPVSYDLVHGSVFAIIWPPGRWGKPQALH